MSEAVKEAAKAEEAKADDGSTTVKLTRKIMVGGDPVTVLTFREPTGGDIEKYGNPIILNFATGAWSYDEPKMTQMMAGLAAVPPSSIRSMKSSDWSTCAVQLAEFFIPDLSQS